MRDDADQPFSLGKAAERMDGLRERLLIERAEALIDEHRIQTDSGRRRGLHLIRKAERERQRGLERLAARERLDAAFRAVVVVDDIKLQTGLGLPVVRNAAALELVLTARHDEQTSVCALKDTIEEGHLDIGFERDLVFPGKRAVRRLRGDLAVHVAAAAIDRADLTGRLIQRVIHHHHHGCICDRFLLGGIRQGSCVIRALAADFCFRGFRLGIAAAGQQQRQKCKKHC